MLFRSFLSKLQGTHLFKKNIIIHFTEAITFTHPNNEEKVYIINKLALFEY